MAPNEAVREDRHFVLDEEKRLLKRAQNTASGIVLGVTYEHRLFTWLRLKPYTSIGQLWLTGLNSYGGGLHIGHEGIIDFIAGTNKSLLVLKTEGRLFSSKYCPGYFGPTYLIDRQLQDQSLGPLTKSQWLSQSGDGYFRVGYLADLSYAYDEMISTSLSYENAHSFADGMSIAPLHKFQFITSLSGFDIVRLQVSYQATAIRQIDQLFDFDKNRGLLSLRGQLKLASIVYLDAWAKHSFGVNDMFSLSGKDYDEPMWLSNLAETRSLNFGLGLELAMTF